MQGYKKPNLDISFNYYLFVSKAKISFSSDNLDLTLTTLWQTYLRVRVKPSSLCILFYSKMSNYNHDSWTLLVDPYLIDVTRLGATALHCLCQRNMQWWFWVVLTHHLRIPQVSLSIINCEGELYSNSSSDPFSLYSLFLSFIIIFSFINIMSPLRMLTYQHQSTYPHMTDRTKNLPIFSKVK